MKNIVSSKQMREQFADILNQVIYTGKEFIISRFDRPVARISPIKNHSLEDQEGDHRRQVVNKISTIRKNLRVNLSSIVISERDKEYKKWKK